MHGSAMPRSFCAGSMSLSIVLLPCVIRVPRILCNVRVPIVCLSLCLQRCDIRPDFVELLQECNGQWVGA